MENLKLFIKKSVDLREKVNNFTNEINFITYYYTSGMHQYAHLTLLISQQHQVNTMVL